MRDPLSPPRRPLAIRARAAIAVALCVLLGASPANAQHCVDYGNRLRVVGWTDSPGTALDIVTDARYAYVTTYDDAWDMGVLEVFGITDATRPRLSATLLLFDGVNGLALSGHHLYLACGLEGYGNLKVIDIADPEHPADAATVPTGAGATRVALAGGYAYVAAGRGGLSIFELSEPMQPTLVASIDTQGEARDVAIAGGIAAIADGGPYGLQLVDVSHPKEPALLGALRLTGYATCVAVNGTYAYLGVGLAQLCVVDFSDPRRPWVVQTVQLSGMPRKFDLDGAQLYVATGTGGFQVLDVSSPGKAKVIGSLYTVDSRSAVFVRDGYAYCADGSQVWVADAHNQTSVSPVGAIGSQAAARDIALQGGWAFVAAGLDGLEIYDVGDPSQPRRTRSIDLSGWTYGVDVVHDHAYVPVIANPPEHGWLSIVDVRAPEAPVVDSILDLPQLPADVAVSAGYAYLAGGEGWLQVVDVEDPHAPALVAVLQLDQLATRVVVAGDRAYVLDTLYYGGLLVIDISNPLAPRINGRAEGLVGVATDLALAGNVAYVTINGGGLVSVDLTNPWWPVVIGRVRTPGWARAVCATAGYAYVLDGRGVQVVDATDPAKLPLVGSLNLQYDGTHSERVGMVAAGGLVYVAIGNGGLQVLPTQCAQAVSVAETAQHRTASLRLLSGDLSGETIVSFDLSEVAQTEVAIYDARGQHVTELLHQELGAGTHRAAWRGVDQTGRRVASGTYFVRLRAGAVTETKKLLLVH